MTKVRDFANVASGLTATATELNILDGATVTTGEVNYNDITTLGTSEASKAVTADASGDVVINNGTLTVSGATALGTGTLTADSQNDIKLFASSVSGNAQAGAYNNRLKIYGGSSQSRRMELYQEVGGDSYINTSYSASELRVTSFAGLNVQDGYVSDEYGNVRDVPLGSSKTSSYTLLASDAGNAVVLDTGGSVVVPTSVLGAGNIVTIMNAQNTTATIDTSAAGLVSYISGDSTDVTSVTIDPRGLCTLYFASSSVVYMSGNIS